MSYLVDGVVATGAGAFHAGETSQSSSPQATPYQETEPDDSTQEPVRSVTSSIPSASVNLIQYEQSGEKLQVVHPQTHVCYLEGHDVPAAPGTTSERHDVPVQAALESVQDVL